MELTAGTLLGGQVRYAQPAGGFRTGIEPVLLAASVPAGAGELVLEGGCGAGAGLLCLAARVPAAFGLGVERDRALALLAARNAADNRARVAIIVADVRRLPVGKGIDHALANPPYHAEGGTGSPDPRRDGAKRAAPGAVAAWAASLGGCLRHGGSLTLIVPPARLPEALAGCAAAGCGSVRLLPLWPKPGRAAKLMLVRAIAGGRAPIALLAGMVLHRPDGGFTEAVEAVLRGGAELAM